MKIIRFICILFPFLVAFLTAGTVFAQTTAFNYQGERVYQGAGLLLSWPLRLGAGERWVRTIRHEVRTTHDDSAAPG
jgi:hypothetical protein